MPITRDRVDHEAGVIRGVKICGFASRNGRRYPREVLAAAAPLYEGRSVRANHPRKATDPRDVDDVLGQLRNVALRDDGLYGDLHLLTQHPMYRRICEAAESMPALYGLSHNSEGEVERVDGIDVVKRIFEVRSVDLVCDPATVSGLFESRRDKPMTLREWAAKLHFPRARAASARATLDRLFEGGYMDPEEEMEGTDTLSDPPADPRDAAPTDHKQALKDGFKSSGHALWDKAIDEQDEGAMSQLAKMHKAHCKLSNDMEAMETGSQPNDGVTDEANDGLAKETSKIKNPDEDDVGSDGGAEGKPVNKKAKTDEQRQLKAREDSARVLCEAADVKPSPALLAALAGLPTDTLRLELIKEHRAAKKAGPRTASPSGRDLIEQEESAPAKDSESFVKAITARNSDW